MKKNLLLIIVLLIAGNLQSQTLDKELHKIATGKENAISFGPVIPIGNFSSHFAGISIQYARSFNRFGPLKIKPSKLIGFTYNGGIEYYLGRKETVSSYDYKYPAYTFLHAYAGIILDPGKKTNLCFTAGPALGIYNGNSQFNIGSVLEGTYYINRKWGINPGLVFMKEEGADPLWAITIRAVYIF